MRRLLLLAVVLPGCSVSTPESPPRDDTAAHLAQIDEYRACGRELEVLVSERHDLDTEISHLETERASAAEWVRLSEARGPSNEATIARHRQYLEWTEGQLATRRARARAVDLEIPRKRAQCAALPLPVGTSR